MSSKHSVLGQKVGPILPGRQRFRLTLLLCRQLQDQSPCQGKQESTIVATTTAKLVAVSAAASEAVAIVTFALVACMVPDTTSR